jgi:F-type H+-transporting ATPase subunit delta
MTTERTSAYADAIVAIARGEHALEAVEDELLAVARAIADNEQLRDTLVDEQLPVGQRLRLLESQALRAAHPTTRTALAMIITAGQTSHLTAIADAVANRAAASRGEELAEVYVAVELDEPRRAALKAALERATGRKLDVKYHVDESVVGGVRAKIGDTVIDGSLARRLTDLRTRAGG